MSLHIFKQTLKPCTENPSSSLSSTSITHSFDPIIPRKPPKSSLSRQLLRLQDPDTLHQTQPHCLPKQPQGHSGGRHEKEEEEEAEAKAEPDGFGRPTKLGQFQFEHTGPFEPLVLSSQGESPLVQVIIILPICNFCIYCVKVVVFIKKIFSRLTLACSVLFFGIRDKLTGKDWLIWSFMKFSLGIELWTLCVCERERGRERGFDF